MLTLYNRIHISKRLISFTVAVGRACCPICCSPHKNKNASSPSRSVLFLFSIPTLILVSTLQLLSTFSKCNSALSNVGKHLFPSCTPSIIFLTCFLLSIYSVFSPSFFFFKSRRNCSSTRRTVVWHTECDVLYVEKINVGLVWLAAADSSVVRL